MKKQMDKEYSDAFNGKPGAEEPAVPDVVIAVGAKNPEDEQAMDDATEPAVAAEETSEVPAEDVTDMATDEGEPSAPEMSAEDTQREKSWEGRLRKREEELAAREAEMSKPADGEALAQLSEQFGPEFADLIVQVIREQVGAPQANADVEALREDVASVISDLKFAMHKRDILAAKADAYEIGETPEFQAWCASQDDAEDCARVVENGTAAEVIGLMTRYEEHLNKDKGSEDEDAATAVRGSAPISLPSRPVAGDDDEYRAAWKNL